MKNVVKSLCLWLALLLMLLLCLPACSPQPAETTPGAEDSSFSSLVLSETASTVTVRDAEGEKTLNKSPKRVVCLYNSILDLWYLNGGEAIARVAGDTELPPAAAALP